MLSCFCGDLVVTCPYHAVNKMVWSIIRGRIVLHGFWKQIPWETDWFTCSLNVLGCSLEHHSIRFDCVLFWFRFLGKSSKCNFIGDLWTVCCLVQNIEGLPSQLSFPFSLRGEVISSYFPCLIFTFLNFVLPSFMCNQSQASVLLLPGLSQYTYIIATWLVEKTYIVSYLLSTWLEVKDRYWKRIVGSVWQIYSMLWNHTQRMLY